VARKGWRNSYLRLNPRVSLKALETPYLYHLDQDELYELNEEGKDFLLSCDGSAVGRDLTDDVKFVRFCVREGLLDLLTTPDLHPIRAFDSPHPSLRYLELQLTRRCNLACRHCYLGPPATDEMPLEDALAIARQFEEMGGLRLMISGGEPLLYPYLREFIEGTRELMVRRIILTNGSLVTKENAGWLRVEEIQFSLDGWRDGHDMVRGKGNFDRVIAGIEAVRREGIPVSIATMIHSGNLGEFERLRNFTEEIGAIQWGVDILCVAGALAENRELIVPYGEAAPFMEYAFGGGYHGSSDGFACGRHLMTVVPTGKAIKCGFYEDRPLGDAARELLSCWQRLEHIPLSALECARCPVVRDCSGGCRYRAAHPLGPDPAMCAIYGIDPANFRKKKGGQVEKIPDQGSLR
jgi:radical SAM protein with 4Fe4S-binding SPASM domain